MTERIIATSPMKARIEAELQAYREHPAHYVKEKHPLVTFATLEALAADPCYEEWVNRPLLHEAFFALAQQLSQYQGCSLLDPQRVYVGIQAPSHAGFWGGFYYSNQGYRYLQQIAVTSLSGVLSCYPIDRTLATLELLRAYTHDTLHYNSYRLFCPLPSGSQPGQSFYRLQYGINFRKWDGRSYSAKDRIRATSTRNLGNIMEAATDRFAHEFVLSLAQKIGYPAPSNQIEDYIYRDCTGQLTPADILYLRQLEQGQVSLDVPLVFQAYLQDMRLFVQYVTMRYRCFLQELDLQGAYRLHDLILEGMLSGKFRKLCQCLDAIQGMKRSFSSLFQTPAWLNPSYLS
ncbi:MAG TPA: hypothetical protein VFV38_50135 [Ktedonobacteraceae bacterium]|nr:hypothetical protein [Ktedonobacteraceae bacterium]